MNFKEKLKLRREAGQAYRQSKLDELSEVLEKMPEVVEAVEEIPEVVEDISEDTPEVIEEPVSLPLNVPPAAGLGGEPTFIAEPPKAKVVKKKQPAAKPAKRVT